MERRLRCHEADAQNAAHIERRRDVLRRYADHYHTKTIKQYLAGEPPVKR